MSPVCKPFQKTDVLVVVRIQIAVAPRAAHTLQRVDDNEFRCWIFMLRGVRPFLSDKYDLTKHPNYKYTADADKKYLFDMERYMKRKPAIVKPDEPFEMYELTAADLQ